MKRFNLLIALVAFVVVVLVLASLAPAQESHFQLTILGRQVADSQTVSTPSGTVTVDRVKNTVSVNGREASRQATVVVVQPTYSYSDGNTGGLYYPATSTSSSDTKYRYEYKADRNGYVNKSAVYEHNNYSYNDPGTLTAAGQVRDVSYQTYDTARVNRDGSYYGVGAVNERTTTSTWSTGNNGLPPGVYGVETRTYNISGGLSAGMFRPSGMAQPGWQPHGITINNRR